MKILVMPKPIDGVGRDALTPHVDAEIRAVWDLYAQGICRECYTRLDEPGRVLLMLETESMASARAALATLPFARLHLIDFEVIPLGSFAGLTRLLQNETAAQAAS